MRCVLCAVALCFVFGINAYADPIVLVPTGGQLSWTHFQGPASDVASLIFSGAGFSVNASNLEATGKMWSGLCPITCLGTVTFNGIGYSTFNWNAGTDGVTATGTLNIFPNGSIPVPPGNPFPTPLFTFVFTATGTVVEDTAEHFLFVFNDQTAVPEPLAVLLFGSGLAGLSSGVLRRRVRDRVNSFLR